MYSKKKGFKRFKLRFSACLIQKIASVIKIKLITITKKNGS